MSKITENLPLELLNKHRESLDLKNPLIIENEDALFETHKDLKESAIIFLPKSKALITMTLSLVAHKVINNGTIILVGSKKGGIESAKKIYEEIIGPVQKKIVGNHSALYVGKNNKDTPPKKVEDFLTLFPVVYKDKTIQVAHLPGVFSAHELDPGTKILVDHLPHEASTMLDLACGTGIVGALYKTLSPKTKLVCSDASLLALEATKKTLEKNNISGKVIRSDVFSHIQEEFDLIAVNPPFHSGIDTDYTFIDKFVKEASQHLTKKGKLYTVANSFLNYKDKLMTIGPTTEVYRDPQYILYCTEKL